MENNIPSEPPNARNICRRENVVLCDKCWGENIKLCESGPCGIGSKMQTTRMDPMSSCVSDNRRGIEEDYPKCTRSHGIHSTKGNFSGYDNSSRHFSRQRMNDDRLNLQDDYSECIGSQGIYSSRDNSSTSMKGNRQNPQEDYPKITGGHGLHSTSAYSSKDSMDLQCTCRITHHQSRSSLSGMDKSLSARLSRLKWSQTRSLTGSNHSVINHVETQKEMESISQITYNRIGESPEEALPHGSPSVAHTQKEGFTYNHPRDGLIVIQSQTALFPTTMDMNKVSHESQEYTQKLADKLPFQALSKCSLLIHKCPLMASKSSIVTSFKDKLPIQQKSLPSQCKLPQCNISGNNPAFYLYHSAVTLLKRTRSSSVFTNSLLILMYMLTLLPLPTHSATNGIPCLYKGSLKSDRSWFGFLTNITIMNTGRMTFQFSYPAEKCCQNILFYLEDQVSILNARMNCWQKESLLRPEDDQILRLTPRFSWSGCHLSHPNGFVGLS